jgi:hypothetical protein
MIFFWKISLGTYTILFALCISIETVEVAFFVTGPETFQIQAVEMSTGGSTKSNVMSFEAILTIFVIR